MRQSAAFARYAAFKPTRQAHVGGMLRRLNNKSAPLAIKIPRVGQTIESHRQLFMRERFPRRNKKGTSTNIVPQIERATTIQTKRRPAGVDGRVENNERRRSQMIGKARKNGAPMRKCHQLP